MIIPSSFAGRIAAALTALLGMAALGPTHAQEIQVPMTVTTDIGSSQTLTLGLDSNATTGVDPIFGEEERPPPPPAGFDARLIDDHIPASGFGEGLLVDIRPGSLRFTGTRTHEIRFQTQDTATEVTLAWTLPDGVTGTIVDRFGGSVYDSTAMSGTGSLTVPPDAPAALVTLQYDGNAAPSLDTNAGITLEKSGTATISTEALSASDPDDPPEALTYTVTDGPSQGTVLVDGTAASSFAQSDLEAGLVAYTHTGASPGTDSLVFDLADSLGPGPTDRVFPITIEPPEHQTTIVGSDGTGNDVGWRLLATPSSATRGDLEDDVEFAADSGSLLHTWDGTQWVGAPNASTPLPRGQGFILYFFDDSTTPITSDGLSLDVPDLGEDQSSDVTVSSLDRDHTHHLLGNPYDVAFDLGHLAGGDLSGAGFQSTVQVWDPSDGGQWTLLTQGTADDNVAAWQGFFVERTQAGSGQTSLAFGAAGRQSGPGSLIGSEGSPAPQATTSDPAEVELALTVVSSADTVAQGRTALLLHDQAAPGWDTYEASQLPPPNAEAYATVSSPFQRSGTSAIVRRALASEPFPTGNIPVTIPLSVRSVGTSGTASLRWPSPARNALPAEWDVELVDTALDTTADLRNGPYTFTLSTGDGTLDTPSAARFNLRVTPTTLPVEMAGFEARYAQGTVRLTWQTASETNNAGFRVQRKQDSGAWRALGFVPSAAQGGTASQPQTYRYTDPTPPFEAATLTYRLQQVDTNGTTRPSGTAVVKVRAPDEVSLHPPFPNPAPQQTTLRFGLPTRTAVRVDIFDVLGRRVTTVVRDRLPPGRHTRRVPVADLAPGTYFIRLHAGNATRTQKLSVVR